MTHMWSALQLLPPPPWHDRCTVPVVCAWLLTLSLAQFTSRNAEREFMEQLSVLEAATETEMAERRNDEDSNERRVGCSGIATGEAGGGRFSLWRKIGLEKIFWQQF